MQREHWKVIANSSQKLYFAGGLGREKYSLFKQRYKQMMPEPLQSHPSVCSFYTLYEALHLFKFRRETFTGVLDIILFSFESNYM